MSMIRATQIGLASRSYHVAPATAERAALAAAFGLPDIAALAGDFVLAQAPAAANHAEPPGGAILASLHMTARVTRICVVTLEPFTETIDERAELRFIAAAGLPEGEDLETFDGPDEIAFTGDFIDLDAALAEQLALSLDPYPRKPGATLPAGHDRSPGGAFAALRGLKRR